MLTGSRTARRPWGRLAALSCASPARHGAPRRLAGEIPICRSASRRLSAAPAASAPSASSRRSSRRPAHPRPCSLLRRRHPVQDRRRWAALRRGVDRRESVRAARAGVEVEDGDGHKGRDTVVLEAFEITEISEVASVLLEAGVYDKKGQFVSGLRSPISSSRRMTSRRRSISSATSASRRRSRC